MTVVSGNRRNISISRGSKQRANRKLRNADRRLILRQKTKRFEEAFRKSRVKIEAECRARFQRPSCVLPNQPCIRSVSR